jgi:hypothetical protein
VCLTEDKIVNLVHDQANNQRWNFPLFYHPVFDNSTLSQRRKTDKNSENAQQILNFRWELLVGYSAISLLFFHLRWK